MTQENRKLIQVLKYSTNGLWKRFFIKHWHIGCMSRWPILYWSEQIINESWFITNKNPKQICSPFWFLLHFCLLAKYCKPLTHWMVFTIPIFFSVCHQTTCGTHSLRYSRKKKRGEKCLRFICRAIKQWKLIPLYI